jgi:hypothetical protein
MEFSDHPTFHPTLQPTNKQPMRTKQQVALSALEQALKLTGVQEPKRDDEFTAGEYADKAEMHTEAARRVLNRYVRDGKLKFRKTPKGHYYSIV